MRILPICCLLVSCLPNVAFAQGKAQGNSGHIPGRLLVQVRRGASESATRNAFGAHHARQKGRLEAIDVVVLEVPEQNRGKIRKGLEDTGLFTFVEEDAVAHGAVAPNDPGYASQWHLGKIQAPAAWDLTRGATAAPVAVIDSGVDTKHPDLMSKLVAGWSFLNGTSNVADVQGHGTAVAGAAAAATDNGTGVAGTAWDTKIMPLVVLDSSNYASYSNIANAIIWAADRGARVITISIGGASASSTLQSAVNYAWNKGAVIFASAMNNGSATPYYPAACDNVLAIGSTNSADARSSFSNYGSWLDLAAPGESIYTTTRGGTYNYWSGTSFASPVAAGVAALVLGVRPAISNATLVSLLKSNADDIGTAGFDNYTGWGRVNAYRAVNAALAGTTSIDNTPPAVTITSPAAGASVSGNVQVQGNASDNVGVSKLEFYVDGYLQATSYSPSFAFSWATAGVVNGVHTLLVKGYDSSQNVSSTSVAVTVNNVTAALDTLAPSVNISSPLNNSRLSGHVKVSASAYDNTAISQVSIYIDGVQVAQCSAAPCSYTWNTRKAAPGSHVITAKAWDLAGNMGASQPITVLK